MLFRTRSLLGALALASLPAWALDVTVTDAGGEPLADAVVALDGGNHRAATDATAVMDQRDRQFVPHVLAVQAGTRVTFPNSDNIRHHVYSFSRPKRFELRLYHGSMADPVTFATPGKVVLGCNIHDSMLGYIYVLPTPHFAVTAADGTVSLTAPAGDYELTVRHPRVEGDARRELTVSGADQAVTVALGSLQPDPRETGPRSELEQMFDQ